MPEVNAYDSILIGIYNQSSGARNGMTGGLEYGVLLDIAKSQGLADFEDLLHLTDEIENNLRLKREKNKAGKGK